MRIRPCLVAVLSVVVVGLGAAPAYAQLSSAEMFVDLYAGVSATDMDVPTEIDGFSDGPRTFDIFSESGVIPWDLGVSAGGGAATTDGRIEYFATTTQIITRGDFSFLTSAESPAAALGDFDAVISINFEVAAETTYSLTGFVSTVRALGAPEVVACQINGVVLAGDSRATPLPAGTYAILAERTLFPEETASLQCSAASSGGQSDSNTLMWEVTVNGLPEPGATLATLASVGALAALARRRRQRARAMNGLRARATAPRP